MARGDTWGKNGHGVGYASEFSECVELTGAGYKLVAAPVGGDKSYQGYYHLFSEIGKEAIPRIDSLVKDEGFSVGALAKYEDLRYIKSQYLLHNTNLAFKMRDSLPWCADIKKEDFLRYVVPYRIGDEELPCWRDSVFYVIV